MNWCNLRTCSKLEVFLQIPELNRYVLSTDPHYLYVIDSMSILVKVSSSFSDSGVESSHSKHSPSQQNILGGLHISLAKTCWYFISPKYLLSISDPNNSLNSLLLDPIGSQYIRGFVTDYIYMDKK